MKDKTKQARELRKKIDRSLDDWKNSKDDLDRLVWFIAIQSPHNLWRAREALGQVLTAKEKEVIERIDKAISQSRKEVIKKVESQLYTEEGFLREDGRLSCDITKVLQSLKQK